MNIYKGENHVVFQVTPVLLCWLLFSILLFFLPCSDTQVPKRPTDTLRREVNRPTDILWTEEKEVEIHVGEIHDSSSSRHPCFVSCCLWSFSLHLVTSRYRKGERAIHLHTEMYLVLFISTTEWWLFFFLKPVFPPITPKHSKDTMTRLWERREMWKKRITWFSPRSPCDVFG